MALEVRELLFAEALELVPPASEAATGAEVVEDAATAEDATSAATTTRRLLSELSDLVEVAAMPWQLPLLPPRECSLQVAVGEQQKRRSLTSTTNRTRSCVVWRVLSLWAISAVRTQTNSRKWDCRQAITIGSVFEADDSISGEASGAMGTSGFYGRSCCSRGSRSWGFCFSNRIAAVSTMSTTMDWACGDLGSSGTSSRPAAFDATWSRD